MCSERDSMDVGTRGAEGAAAHPKMSTIKTINWLIDGEKRGREKEHMNWSVGMM